MFEPTADGGRRIQVHASPWGKLLSKVPGRV